MYWISACRQRSTSISRLSELPRGWSERWTGSLCQRRKPRCQTPILEHPLSSPLTRPARSNFKRRASSAHCRELTSDRFCCWLTVFRAPSATAAAQRARASTSIFGLQKVIVESTKIPLIDHPNRPELLRPVKLPWRRGHRRLLDAGAVGPDVNLEAYVGGEAGLPARSREPL